MAWSMRLAVLSYLFVSCLSYNFFSTGVCDIFFPRMCRISAHLNGYCNFIISLLSLFTYFFILTVACSQQTKKKNNTHMCQSGNITNFPKVTVVLCYIWYIKLPFWPSSFEMPCGTALFLAYHTTYFLWRPPFMWFNQPALIFSSASRFVIKWRKLNKKNMSLEIIKNCSTFDKLIVAHPLLFSYCSCRMI